MIQPAQRLDDVHYEIRGALAKRAAELEHMGREILYLNIGNPGAFGFKTPETMRQAVIANIHQAEAYGHQLGIFPAREAVAMAFQDKGLKDTRYQDVIIGNGVSELVDLTLRALLNPGDEVLIPAPDYPLWSAAVTLNGGKPVYYPCPASLGFEPDLEALASRITQKTRALVVINPNNPTGAVYSDATLAQLARFAEDHGLLLLADEIYDSICFDGLSTPPLASFLSTGVCISFGGLSKVYRACGYRIGWAVLSGDRDRANAYWLGIEKLAALRLSANVLGQWAVQTALGGHQSIEELVNPGGRLHEAREAVLAAVANSRHLSLVTPQGALYAFPSIDAIAHAHQAGQPLPFDDQAFAQALLEKKHILVVPGTSFHLDHPNHFRITLLPEASVLSQAMSDIESLLDEMVP